MEVNSAMRMIYGNNNLQTLRQQLPSNLQVELHPSRDWQGSSRLLPTISDSGLQLRQRLSEKTC